MGYAVKKAIEVVLALAFVTVMIAGCGSTPQEEDHDTNAAIRTDEVGTTQEEDIDTGDAEELADEASSLYEDEATEDADTLSEEIMQPVERITVPVDLDDLPQFVMSDGRVIQTRADSMLMMPGVGLMETDENSRIRFGIGPGFTRSELDQLLEPQWAVLTDFWIPHNIDFVLEDLYFLAGMTNLRFLSVEGSFVSDLTPIANLRNLEILQLGGDFDDLSPLAGLRFLEFVQLSDNRLGDGNISDLSPFANMPYLRVLLITGGRFSDLSPLAGLTGLEELGLALGDVSDLSPLAGLTNLVSLTLVSNNIYDLSPLAGLTSLELLDIRGNNVIDLTPLAHLTGLEIRN